MAVLIDLSQLCISGVFAYSAFGDALSDENPDKERVLGILRHVVLSQIKAYKKKFSNEYGEVIISCDGRHYWRKNIFPNYKSERKKARESNHLDWRNIFDSISDIVQELKDVFPYRTILVNEAESDDVIATLTKKFVAKGEKVLIISSDRDFVQLQKYKGVFQFSPQTKKFILSSEPLLYLQEKILRGDKGDSIPNILSMDDTFVKGLKQRTLTKKRIEKILLSNNNFDDDEELKKRYIRNRNLIDFDYIPKEIEEKILKEYEQPIKGSKGKIFNYLIEKKCGSLLKEIENF